MKLHTLKPVEGSVKQNRRVGRGQGSGSGETAGKGTKGAQQRAGYNTKWGFEGGQTPLKRRSPKYGFTNPFRVENQVVSLTQLQELHTKNTKITTMDPKVLKENGVVSSLNRPLKVLANGKLNAKLTVKAHKFSASAKTAIENAGGEAIVLENKTKKDTN